MVLGMCVLVFCCGCVCMFDEVCVLCWVRCILCMVVGRCRSAVRRLGVFVLARGFDGFLRMLVGCSGFVSSRLSIVWWSVCCGSGPRGEVVAV